MKILFAVPSKNRVNVLQKFTWQWLKDFPDARIFVEPQDFVAYSAAMPEAKIVRINQNNQGLAYVKYMIADHADFHGYDFIFKLDDDIRGWTDWRKRTDVAGSVKVFQQILDDAREIFANSQIKAVTFPYSFQMYKKEKWSLTSRIQTAYIARTNNFGPRHGINVFEDFCTGLKIRVNGGIIAKYGLAGIDLGVPVGKGEGGLQMFDRDAMAKKEIELLRKIYPSLKIKTVTGKRWTVEPIMSIPYPKNYVNRHQ